MDRTGKKCKKCGKGRYEETRLQDDWDGVLHCTKCNTQVKRYTKEHYKKKKKPPVKKKLEVILTECSDYCVYYDYHPGEKFLDKCLHYGNKSVNMEWAKGQRFPATCPLDNVND